MTLDDKFWTGSFPVCQPHNSDDNSLFQSLPVVSLELLYKQGRTISLNIAPEQYMRPVKSTRYDEDCYKIGISDSSHGTVIGTCVLTCSTIAKNKGRLFSICFRLLL